MGSEAWTNQVLAIALFGCGCSRSRPALLRTVAAPSDRAPSPDLHSTSNQATTMAPVASPSNPYKRHIDAVQRVYDCAKRLKTSNESSPSPPPTLSEQSTLIPTAAPEDTVEASEAESEESWVSESSEEPSDESDLEESDEGSAADEDDDEDGEEEEEEEEGEQHDQDDQEEVDKEQAQDAIVNLPANRGAKPTYKLHEEDEVDDIRSFLKDFIPKLKAANEELEAQKEAGTLQTTEIIGEGHGDSEEQYIEMVSC